MARKDRKKRSRKGLLLTIVMIACMAAGVGLLLYPSIANYWNSLHQTGAILNYTEQVSHMSEEQYEEILERAREYNSGLAERGIVWTVNEERRAEYEKELAVAGSNVMAYISIPKINIKLPIYHGTDAKVLQTGIGHLEATSLPVGGESTHCVISGHRGLPSSRLFTDLDLLVEGDTWTINVLNETLTYEVDSISVVEPNDLSTLVIEPGQDLCTLVTCTPYGINTHRLLIRGHRIPNPDGNANITADAIQIQRIYVVPFVAVPLLVLVLIVFRLTSGKRRKPRKAA